MHGPNVGRALGAKGHQCSASTTARIGCFALVGTLAYGLGIARRLVENLYDAIISSETLRALGTD